MHRRRRRIALGAVAGALIAGFWLAAPATAAAQDSASTATDFQNIQFILSTFSFLVWGVLVMWMCAGFTMLESGTVRTKNASMICLKNVGIYSIACLSFFFVGYNLMYVDVGSFIGRFKLLHGPTDVERALFDGVSNRVDEIVGAGHSSMSMLFFQMLFVATTASIVSGAILERAKLWVFWAFTAVLTAFIYPVVGAWVWGGGWLADMGFQDFAGATVVHTTGGCAALAAVLVVGPRRGKFRLDGSVKATPPSNVLVVTLGVLILWLGWFGFNAGSRLALATPDDAVVMSSVMLNTNLAGASGLLAAVILSRPLFGRLGLAPSLNGALAGLVAITAGPDFADSYWAVVIGFGGGVLCTLATKLMERLKLDDVVGAIPVHMVSGIWGSLAASFASGADLGVQLLGVGAVAGFVFVTSFIVWMVIEATVGMRVSRDVEYVGQDVGELGIESHPEFVLVPENFDDYKLPVQRVGLGRRRHRPAPRSPRPMTPGERRPGQPGVGQPGGPRHPGQPGAGQPQPPRPAAAPVGQPGAAQPGAYGQPGAGQAQGQPAGQPGAGQPQGQPAGQPGTYGQPVAPGRPGVAAPPQGAPPQHQPGAGPPGAGPPPGYVQPPAQPGGADPQAPGQPGPLPPAPPRR